MEYFYKKPQFGYRRCKGAIGKKIKKATYVCLSRFVWRRQAPSFAYGRPSACGNISLRDLHWTTNGSSRRAEATNLFSGQEADEDSDLWGLLACLVYELYPEELMHAISRAY